MYEHLHPGSAFKEGFQRPRGRRGSRDYLIKHPFFPGILLHLFQNYSKVPQTFEEQTVNLICPYQHGLIQHQNLIRVC